MTTLVLLYIISDEFEVTIRLHPYLGKPGKWELLEAELATLSGLVVELSKVYPGRRQGHHGHSVAQEQDHVLCCPFV